VTAAAEIPGGSSRRAVVVQKFVAVDEVACRRAKLSRDVLVAGITVAHIEPIAVLVTAQASSELRG
jgi:hypothetical protein